MLLELSKDEAKFLKAQLSLHQLEVENELVRTDARDLQAALARDLQLLREITRKIGRLIDSNEAAA